MPDTEVTRLLALHDGVITARALHLAAELGVADLLASGPLDVTALAAATSTRPDPMHRLLRALASAGVFAEIRPGTFELTPLGQPLRTDHPRSVRSYLRFGDEVARAFDGAAHSLRTGEAGFDVTFGESFFGWLRNHPERAGLFDAAMSELGVPEDAAIVAAYDFAGVRSIVDVGGGRGTLLRSILLAHPAISGVLFDQAAVLATARELIDKAGLTQRCTLESGDFFAQVPSGADVYLLKSVIHDWPDDQAVTILANCRRAMASDGRLLLAERLIPPGDDPHPSKLMDLAMLILLGGKERTTDEYAILLTAAGFGVRRVVSTASAMTIIEAVPNPESIEEKT